MAPSIAINALRSAVRAGRIEWRRHALERMIERGISRVEVKAVLLKGEKIEDYPHDNSLPAALFFGRPGRRPLHVVVAFDRVAATAFVVTAYPPDLKHFRPDLRTRRKP